MKIREHFPFRTRDIEVQYHFTRNVLHITQYAPVLQDRLLATIIDKMVEIDVQIKLDDDDGAGTAEQQLQFEVECDGDNTDEGNDLMAEKLDVMMTLMLGYLQTHCGPQNAAAVDMRRPVFDSLLSGFDHYILHTHRSKCAQFLVFYVCSLDPQFTDTFMGYLHHKLFDSSCTVLARRTCASYISSFLARALFVRIDVVKTSVDLLTAFLHAYIERHEVICAYELSLTSV